MDRILEPEIMDGEAEAGAYARADFSDSNQWYVDHFMRDYPRHVGEVVDLGCGPADIPVRLAQASAAVHITAVDGYEPRPPGTYAAARETGSVR